MYSTITQIQNRLANTNLGVAGATIVTDTQINEMIEEANAIINAYLQITSDTTSYETLLRKIEIDLVFMMILQTRHMKNNNEVEGVSNYWSVTPSLTYDHLKFLNRIKKNIKTQSYSYDINTAKKVYP